MKLAVANADAQVAETASRRNNFTVKVIFVAWTYIQTFHNFQTNTLPSKLELRLRTYVNN